jgi:succinoglycan biosynthesis transport protein ExoP
MLSVLGMFFRAKKTILVSFVCLFGCVLLLLAVKPRKYQSQMTFLLRNERAEPLVGSDPKQNSIQLPDVTEEDQNSEVELLTSAEVLRAVVLNCHLAADSKPSSIESATSRLSKALTVSPVRNSSIINVEYDSTSAQKAHDVLRELANMYLAKRADLHTASQAAVFFDAQTTQAQGALQQIQEERSKFLSEHGYEHLPQQMQLALEYEQTLQSQVDAAQTQLQETEGRLRQIAADRQVTPERLSTQQRSANNPYAQQQLTSALVILENKKAELLTKFTPQDRLIQQTNTEIKNTEDALAQFSTIKPHESVSDSNPAWQALDAESNTLRETKIGLDGRIAQLQAQLGDEQQRLEEMQNDSVHVADLDRMVKEATDRSDLYESKRVAAKIGDDLDAQHISNVVIASVPTTPVRPQASPFNLTSGFLLSLVGSLTLGFLSQLLSPRMYGASTVESLTGVPVIAMVPFEAKGEGVV